MEVNGFSMPLDIILLYKQVVFFLHFHVHDSESMHDYLVCPHLVIVAPPLPSARRRPPSRRTPPSRGASAARRSPLELRCGPWNDGNYKTGSGVACMGKWTVLEASLEAKSGGKSMNSIPFLLNVCSFVLSFFWQHVETVSLGSVEPPTPVSRCWMVIAGNSARSLGKKHADSGDTCVKLEDPFGQTCEAL